MTLAEFGTGQVFWSMLWFFLFFIWIWILITVFADLFRSHDLSGWAKAAWVIFVIILPYLGVFVYLIARGHKMHEHAAQDMAAAQANFDNQVRAAAGSRWWQRAQPISWPSSPTSRRAAPSTTPSSSA